MPSPASSATSPDSRPPAGARAGTAALLLDAPGEPASLRLGRLAVPRPGPGQVRLRVAACGLNPVDCSLLRRGSPAWTWPHVLGLDVVGDVDALGEGTDPDLLGRRVAIHHDLRCQGGYARYVVVDALALAEVPRALEVLASRQGVGKTVMAVPDTAVEATATGAAAGRMAAGAAAQAPAHPGAGVGTTRVGAAGDRGVG